MSTSYNPIFGVGKYFDEYEDAMEWYCEVTGKDYSEFKAEIEEDWYDDFGEYLLKTHSHVEGSVEDCWSGSGYFIYIPVEATKASTTCAGITIAGTLWFDMFKENPEVVVGVCIC